MTTTRQAEEEHLAEEAVRKRERRGKNIRIAKSTDGSRIAAPGSQE